jgi:hypothetical protein
VAHHVVDPSTPTYTTSRDVPSDAVIETVANEVLHVINECGSRRFLHHLPDLDSVNKHTICEEDSSCLSRTRADFEDERSRGKQLGEVCVQGSLVSGSDFVVHIRDVVKRLSPDRSLCHGRKSRADS